MYFFIIPLLAASYKVLLRFIFVCVLSCLVMSNSLRPHGLQPVRLLRPWNFPGNNPSMSCHFLHQRIFLTQGSNPCVLLLLHLQVGSLPLVPPIHFPCHLFLGLLFIQKFTTSFSNTWGFSRSFCCQFPIQYYCNQRTCMLCMSCSCCLVVKSCLTL